MLNPHHKVLLTAFAVFILLLFMAALGGALFGVKAREITESNTERCTKAGGAMIYNHNRQYCISRSAILFSDP